jgi:hypothetical protein
MPPAARARPRRAMTTPRPRRMKVLTREARCTGFIQKVLTIGFADYTLSKLIN